MKNQKLTIHEYVFPDFSPEYKMHPSFNNINMQDLTTKRIENLVLELYTPWEENEIKEKEVKEKIPLLADKGLESISKDSLNEIEEIKKKYKNCEIDEDVFYEKIDKEFERVSDYEKELKTLKNNLESSEIEIYSVPKAREVIENSKTLNKINDSRCMNKHLYNQTNDEIKKAYRYYDDI